MKKKIFAIILFWTILLCQAFAQQVIVIDTINSHLNRLFHPIRVELQPGIIYDIAVPQHIPPNQSGALSLHSANGAPIHWEGYPNFDVDYPYTSRLFITSDTTPETIQNFVDGVGITQAISTGTHFLPWPTHVVSPADMMFIDCLFDHPDTGLWYPGWRVYVCDDETQDIYNVQQTNVTADGITLSWSDSSQATQWRVVYGSVFDEHHFQLNYFDEPEDERYHFYSVETNTPSVTLSGLEHSRYFYRIYNNAGTDSAAGYCKTPIRQFVTYCPAAYRTCIDHTDLENCATEPYYGHYDGSQGRLYEHFGLDNGLRHQIITTPSTDAHTANQLSKLPPNGQNSVMLGIDWSNSGSHNESVVYRLHVDTSQHDSLLVHYAMVGQNSCSIAVDPGYFAISLRDSAFNLIDSVHFSGCDESLDWQPGSTGYKWLDWHTFPIDLAPYHGRNIMLDLTSRPTVWYQSLYSYYAVECTGHPVQYEHMQVTLCPDSCFSIYDTTICESGDYYIDVDEYHQLHLTVEVTTIDTNHMTLSGCDSVMGSGMVFTQSGDYLFDGLDCAHKTMLHVTVGHSHVTDTTIELTNQDYQAPDGHTYTHSTDTDIRLTGANGCDSIIRLHLIIHHTDTIASDTACCGSIILNGVEYTHSGNVVTATDVHGDDTTYHIVHVTLYPTYDITNYYTLYNDSLLWIDSLWYTESTTEPMVYYTTVDGCDSIIRLNLVVHNEALIWIPNAFTPDLETNNRFQIITYGVTEVEVTIFDRWGNTVACFNGLDGYWDGTHTGPTPNLHNGTPCKQDTYVYLVYYRRESSSRQLQRKTGTITLIH